MEVKLDRWRWTDFPALLKYANDPQIAENLRDIFPYPYTEKNADIFLTNCIRDDGHGKIYRVILIGGEAVGSVEASRGEDIYCKNAEIGYWLARRYWGQGIATEAVRQMCEMVFAQWDVVRLFAECFARNTASHRVLEKNGFTWEATLKSSIYKHGQLLDARIYSRLRDSN